MRHHAQHLIRILPSALVLVLFLMATAVAGPRAAALQTTKGACATGALTPEFAAVLFDDGAAGDGFYLVQDAANLSIAFFGYDAGGSLLWLVGTIARPATGEALDASIPLVEVGPRGRFAVPQDPLSDPIPPWGTLELSLACGGGTLTGTATLDGSDGTKTFALSALVAGGGGAAAGDALAAERLGAVLFDAAVPGDGLYLVGDTNNVSLAFFGYEADGEPLWLVSTLPTAEVDLGLAGTTRFPMTLGGPQGAFSAPQNPLATPLPPWGALELTLDCAADGALVGVAVLDGIDGAKPIELSALLDQGACPDGLEPATIAISTSAGVTPAYDPVDLTVTTPLPLEQLTLQVDVSGTGRFRSFDTLSGPLLVEDDQPRLVAPPLSYFQGGSRYRYDVRLLGPGGAASNVLRFEQAPKGLLGKPRGMSAVALDLILQVMFGESDDPILTSAAGQVQPGATEELLQGLGEGTGDLNEAAAGLLEGSFDFDIDDYPPPDGRKDLEGPRAAVTAIFDCLFPLLEGGELAPTDAADQCRDVAVASVTDGILPELPVLHARIARASARLSTLLATRAGRELGGYRERVAFQVQSSAYASAFARLSLRLPAVQSDPGAAVDFVDGQLTEFGRGRLFETLTLDLTAFNREIVALLSDPAALTAAANLSAEQLAALRGLENEVVNTTAFGGELAQNPRAFGGTGEPDFETPALGLPGTELLFSGLSAEEICAQDPDLREAAGEFGFPSCEAFVTPFLDPVYLQTVLLPLLQDLADLFRELDAAGCFLPGASPTLCFGFFERADGILNLLIAALQDFGSTECASGYRSFPLGPRTACVWTPLVASTGSTSCPTGSRVPTFDLGQPACVFYSRDIVRSGQCAANYALVFFAPIGAETCRWADLPLSLPAAYSVDTTTGSRTTLER